MIGRLTTVTIAGAMAWIIGSALFERLAPPRWVTAYRRANMALYRPSAGVVPGWAVIETTGRRSGRPRQTPVGSRLRNNSLWVVVGNRSHSQWVKNIEADPNVRVRVHGNWRPGTARLLPKDNPRRRLMTMNPLNSLFIWIAGKDLATIRVAFTPATPS
jgi:deazaflavin-dependent oxidoreductase (nitroreductase family)